MNVLFEHTHRVNILAMAPPTQMHGIDRCHDKQTCVLDTLRPALYSMTYKDNVTFDSSCLSLSGTNICESCGDPERILLAPIFVIIKIKKTGPSLKFSAPISYS